MAIRRRLGWAVAIVAGATMLGVFAVDIVATGTGWGRKKFIGWALNLANGTLGGRGSLTVGVLHELSSGGIRASDVSLLDSAGVVVLHVNELRGALSYGALVNKQIHITQLDVSGVQLTLKRDFKGPWNIAYIINGGPPQVGPRLPGYADDIRIDAIRLSDGAITMQYPWQPNVVFKGPARDSVIEVRKKLHDITVVSQGLLEKRRIVLPRLVTHDVLVATPGDDPSSMQLDSLGGTISDPAIRIVQAGGLVQWTPDSVMLDLSTVRLPASVGSAKGTVRWNQPGPVRYDVNVAARAGLSDLGWIWDVLPDSGTGTANVRLRTLANADDAEYTLSRLDVSTMNSVVQGDITVVVRPAQMLLQDVDLTFAPLRSELLRRLSYDAVPPEVKGTFRGRLVAKAGGPVTALQVDRLDALFIDDQVSGARSSLSASGLVGLGSNPTARNVRITNADVDLRSVRVLAPTTPPMDGRITGNLLVATADLKHASVPSLDLSWVDAAGNTSHITGRASAGFGGRVPIVNTELLLDPLSLQALVRVDSTFPISSALRGTVSATGPLDSLKWAASLLNGVSKLQATGTASLRDSLWMIRANTDLAAIDLRSWIGRDDIPLTNLNGTLQFGMAAQLRADSTTHISEASFSANLTQGAAEGLPAFELKGVGALDEKRLRIDSAAVLLGGIAMDLKGALARDSMAVDTLVASLQVDSLAAARPELIRLADMIFPLDSGISKSIRSYAADTLDGDVSGSAVMVGALPAFSANVSLSARQMQVGIIEVRRVFGSVRATGLPDNAHFDATATIDDISGIGQIKLTTAEFRIEDASPSGGRLRLDVIARDTTALRLRGDFTRVDSVLTVRMDSVRFNYGDALWLNAQPAVLISDARGTRVDSLVVRSNQQGLLSLNADVPIDGEVNALLKVERFPAGEVASFAMATETRYSGLLTGETKLTGTRVSPHIVWNMIGDSVGTVAVSAPPLVTDGIYDNKRLVAHVVLEDSVRSRLRFEARVPIDFSLQTVEKRLLSDEVDAEIVADTLQLEGLPIAINGVSALRGTLAGRIALSGTFERPIATGRMALSNFGASADILGIKPTEGQLVLVAAEDQLTVERFRFRSGDRAADTVGIMGVLSFPADKPMSIDAKMVANNAALARMEDGTDLDLSGTITAKGELKKPDVAASLFVPRASIIADPLGARAALDLSSADARALLGETEVPVAAGVVDPLAQLGQFMNVTQASVQLGEQVWVRTPEAAVRLGGALDIKSGANGLLALDGEVTANRGTFLLDLNIVKRNFAIDSGRVRFYGSDAIKPTVNVHATHVVRASGSVDTPIRVAITGTFDQLALRLSTDDEVFSGAPESEVISLLIFGAPTFALNQASQNAVKAVRDVLLPSLGGFFEGELQRLLRVNTVQLNAASGSRDERSATTASSLLDNLTLEAGKQIGDRTFLRFNGGLCRGSSSGVRLTSGLAAEYRIRRSLLAQIGVDQGASPCTQLDNTRGLPHQFGFDLFREWVF
ncbi:MAG: translocation/assembly module TamB domain-containing protein [Phycisphaerae bacterium]|nr:translocation/assembly module TamB domain-containing protein [Gemmatimonadaceae bacterium]